MSGRRGGRTPGRGKPGLSQEDKDKKTAEYKAAKETEIKFPADLPAKWRKFIVDGTITSIVLTYTAYGIAICGLGYNNSNDPVPMETVERSHATKMAAISLSKDRLTYMGRVSSRKLDIGEIPIFTTEIIRDEWLASLPGDERKVLLMNSKIFRAFTGANDESEEKSDKDGEEKTSSTKLPGLKNPEEGIPEPTGELCDFVNEIAFGDFKSEVKDSSAAKLHAEKLAAALAAAQVEPVVQPKRSDKKNSR